MNQHGTLIYENLKIVEKKFEEIYTQKLKE